MLNQIRLVATICFLFLSAQMDRRFAFPSTNHPKKVDNRPNFRLFIYLYRDFLQDPYWPCDISRALPPSRLHSRTPEPHEYIPSDTTIILNAYLKHSIRYSKYIKCIFKTFHQIQPAYYRNARFLCIYAPKSCISIILWLYLVECFKSAFNILTVSDGMF